MSEEATPEKKPYDLKELTKLLQAEGLDLAEEAAEKVLTCTFAWLRESAELSPNKWDDLAVKLLGPAERFLKKQIDKLDGQPG